jgi:hypothetical protein
MDVSRQIVLVFLLVFVLGRCRLPLGFRVQ